MKRWIGTALLLALVAGCGSADPEPVGIKAACARVAHELPASPGEAASGAWQQFAGSLRRLSVEGDQHVKAMVKLLQPAADAAANPAGRQIAGTDLLRLRSRLRSAMASVDAVCP